MGKGHFNVIWDDNREEVRRREHFVDFREDDEEVVDKMINYYLPKGEPTTILLYWKKNLLLLKQ
jgi:hypothetical protein